MDPHEVSPLERRHELGDLLDPAACQRIVEAACALAGGTVALCSRPGEVLALAGRAPPAEALAAWPEPGQTATFGPGGAPWVVHPIAYEAETWGTVVVGGTLGLEGGRVAQLVERAAAALLEAGYARRLVTDLHEAVTADAFRELEDKNQRLAEMVARLEEVDRLKSSFLATVSHELRTPLTSVIGYSEMLLEGLAGQLSPEQREYVRTIMEKGEQLLRLISAILEISRIEAGTAALTRQVCEARGLVEDALGALYGQAQRKGVDLAVEVASGLPPLAVDREKIRQAIAHVVANAVKFTPAAGRVRVVARTGRRTKPPPGRAAPAIVEIVVADTGIGIAPDAVPRVFEAFYQADSSSTREYGGVGLGLTIARSFVEAHGGTIRLESVPGRGTTVVVALPVVATTPPAASAARGGGGGGR